jgi:hypothetical protein
MMHKELYGSSAKPILAIEHSQRPIEQEIIVRLAPCLYLTILIKTLQVQFYHVPIRFQSGHVLPAMLQHRSHQQPQSQ